MAGGRWTEGPLSRWRPSLVVADCGFSTPIALLVEALSPYNPAHPLLLTPGTRLGPYEILSAIGAGGMGEVYKSRDTRLDRTVAIKILPEAFADADRVARFQTK